MRTSAKGNELTAARHEAVRVICRAAGAAGHEVLDLANRGQDAAFRIGNVLVNVEVKAMLRGPPTRAVPPRARPGARPG